MCCIDNSERVVKLLTDDTLHSKYELELSQYDTIPFFKNGNKERYINYKMMNQQKSWMEIITFINLDLDNKFYSNIKIVTDPDSHITLVNKHNQLPKDFIPKDLEEINSAFSIEGLKLRHIAREAFEEMCIAASRIGLILTAISTYRSYTYQEKVYLKWKTDDIMLEDYQRERDKVSARAGHSEHQTGLAVDINDLEETFEQTAEGIWLARNSYQFGFILRYPKGKESITGYNYEPWHFRYVGLSLAEAILRSGITYDEYYIRYLRPEIET